MNNSDIDSIAADLENLAEWLNKLSEDHEFTIATLDALDNLRVQCNVTAAAIKCSLPR